MSPLSAVGCWRTTTKSPSQIAAFKTAGTQVLVGVAHENYGHLAFMSEATRAALATDFD